MPKLDLSRLVAAKGAAGAIKAMKGQGWSWEAPAASDGNLLNLSVAPDSSGAVNHWVVESFSPLVMKAVSGQTSALTGWPFFAENRSYRISWDYTPIGFSMTGGDVVRVRADNTGSNTGKLFSQSNAAGPVGSYTFRNTVARTLWIGPALTISSSGRLQVNKFLLEAV